MSSNKTIKALREERARMHVAIRTLTEKLAANKLSEPYLPLTDEQEVAFDNLMKDVSFSYGIPLHMLFGLVSREELEAHRHKQSTNRSVTVPVEDLPPLNWPVVVSGTINFIGADKPEQVWAHIEHGQWNCDILADLIRETTSMDGERYLKAGTIVWRGTKRFDDPAGFVPGSDEIINMMAENAACSDAGEWADDYPNVTEEAKTELDDFLTAWARKHAPVESFYTVEAIEQYTVTAEDLAQ